MVTCPCICAAQWIASEGGRRTFALEDVEIWEASYNALLSAISSEKVRAVGSLSGQTQPVPAQLLAGIRVDYPFSEGPVDLLLSQDLVLRSYPYIDEEHWRNGFDDALGNRAGLKWNRLMVEKGDIRALWPFADDPRDTVELGTGLQGRPGKSRHLIEDELRRRAKKNVIADNLASEAEALVQWLQTNYPPHAPTHYQDREKQYPQGVQTSQGPEIIISGPFQVYFSGLLDLRLTSPETTGVDGPFQGDAR